MGELVLRLLPDNHEPQEVVLKQHSISASILDAANTTSAYVLNDYKYRAQIVSDSYEEINNPVFLLNGKVIDLNYASDTGMLFFRDYSFGQCIFRECYGFIQITIIYEDAQGNRQIKDTEFIQVLVRKGPQNESVKQMVEYVYSHSAYLLYDGQMLSKALEGQNDSAQKTIESHILLLKQISVTYEENYRFFKMNSRFITTPQEHVDHFEKLQYVSRNTLQYIAQHPEQLHLVHHNSGIQINSFRYQPVKTLVTDNEKSYDIYENRVVLGFLSYLILEISRIEKELSEIVSRVPTKLSETDGYVSSSYFIYERTIDTIKEILGNVQELHHRFRSLYYMYAEIFPLKPEKIVSVPRLTPLFRAIPQYHQIFDCVVAWFSKGAFSIQKEQFMLSFIRISTLYEVYVLSKLINYYKDSGFTLSSMDRIQYPSPGKYYSNTSCNNRFVFKKESVEITLYYQPVIYNTNRKEISGINLYRNTSISFPSTRDGTSYRGKYYTPDLLIKYEYDGRTAERYLIADAKYSRVDTVKNRELAELAYKYLFSISPVFNDSRIIGMSIFNGIPDVNDQASTSTNVYDFELETPITPCANIITLTETSGDSSELHRALLRNAVGIYASESPLAPVPLPISRHAAYHAPTPSFVYDTNVHSLERDNTYSSKLLSASDKNTRSSDYSNMLDTARVEKESNSFLNESKKRKGAIILSELPLSELHLDKTVEEKLISAGYTTLRDLVPNKEKNDLISNPILNRKNRREIEARLKQRRVFLS